MLAITGGKGGCGKTTVALGLARVLARDGRAPLVVDADVDMPDLHVLAGTDARPHTDHIAGGHPVEAVAHEPSRLPGVVVVPAGSPGQVPAALARLDRWHGPVLVDCPAGLGPDATRPLSAADRSVLVATSDPQSLADTRKTASAARAAGAAPVGALVRGDAPSDALECPVEPLPELRRGRVYTDPRFTAACRSVLDRIGRGPGIC